MNIFDLKNNITASKKILNQIKTLEKEIAYSSINEKTFYQKSIESLKNTLKLLNLAIPSIVAEISLIKKLDDASIIKKDSNISNFIYNPPSQNDKLAITLNKQDKEKFLKELSITEEGLKKISDSKKDYLREKPSKLARISNKIFGNFSEKISQSLFQDLKKDLREANSRFLLATYIAMALFCSLTTFFFGLLFMLVLVIFNPASLMFIWIPFILSILMFVGFYLYPSVEKANIEKSITNELPFATIYMAAIAGSNIEPTKIFKIISNSPEYKNVGIEIRKVLNQVELYGYDLVTSLRNTAKSTSNKKLAELLNGMATNIVSGGSLKNFLEKKSENLLTDYKLERQSYNAVSETFMDIYISVLITAPLILVMMVVIMGITNLNIGNLTTETMIVGSIALVVIINIFFLIFLQLKQPKT